jgi:hypothetical protein
MRNRLQRHEKQIPHTVRKRRDRVSLEDRDKRDDSD